MALGLINPSGVKGILHKGYLGMGIGKRITWEMQQAVSMVLMACCICFFLRICERIGLPEQVG